MNIRTEICSSILIKKTMDEITQALLLFLLIWSKFRCQLVLLGTLEVVVA